MSSSKISNKIYFSSANLSKMLFLKVVSYSSVVSVLPDQPPIDALI